MGAVEVYVVRIHRRFTDDPEHVEGIVETPGSHETFAFRMRDELMRLVFRDAPVKRRKALRASGGGASARGKRRAS
jgi:hypothetical protein